MTLFNLNIRPAIKISKKLFNYLEKIEIINTICMILISYEYKDST